MKKMDTSEVVSYVIGYFIGMLIVSFIFFWCGYFMGWLAEITIGTRLARALNMLFNVSYFAPEKLPMIAGALSWLGSFFHGWKLDLKD